jgi:antitoxin ParD1/3/4
MKLIRENQKRREEQSLQALLLESLESGESIKVDSDFWLKKRQNLLKRLEQNES